MHRGCNRSNTSAKASLPANYEAAKAVIAECLAVDQCKDWADAAEALASYYKQAGDDYFMKNAIRLKDRAIRRAGELLKQIEPQQGANQNIRAGDHPKAETRKDVAEAAGISPHQAKQAIRVANVPAADFERQVEGPNPPTITALAEQGKKAAPRPVIDLKGRAPSDFNLALHYVAGWVKFCSKSSRNKVGVRRKLNRPGFVGGSNP